MSDFYPELPEGTGFALDIILQNLAEDPEYLEEAPYSDEEMAALRRIADLTRGDAPLTEEGEVMSGPERLEHETQALFRDLTDFRKSLDKKDNAETMSYFRVAAQLLDKIVGIQERASNLKQISQFYSIVLDVMEDTLEPEQRTEVVERLQAAQKAGS